MGSPTSEESMGDDTMTENQSASKISIPVTIQPCEHFGRPRKYQRVTISAGKVNLTVDMVGTKVQAIAEAKRLMTDAVQNLLDQGTEPDVIPWKGLVGILHRVFDRENEWYYRVVYPDGSVRSDTLFYADTRRDAVNTLKKWLADLGMDGCAYDDMGVIRETYRFLSDCSKSQEDFLRDIGFQIAYRTAMKLHIPEQECYKWAADNAEKFRPKESDLI